MKVAGIIAEYNPFHKGHAYHIQKTREITGADYVIAVISGDFVQRGAPAFLPKHFRTKMALLGGADVVFELPSVYSCESAEYFARRGVELLDGLGCVDYLSFGSETGNISLFQELGAFLNRESQQFQTALRSHLKNGLSYPAAREAALLSSFPHKAEASVWPGELLSSPNNILGIEYCKALDSINSNILPVTVLRQGSGYHDENLQGNYPSASALRKAACDQNLSSFEELHSGFPEKVWEFLKTSSWENQILTEQDFSLLFRQLLYFASPEKMTSCQDMSQELFNRIRNTRDKYENFSQYVGLLKTKELTYSRICRALFHALLDIHEVPPLFYARLLGFHKTAGPLLQQIKQHSALPILTKLADASSVLSSDGEKILKENIRISHLYESVFCEKYSRKFINEYTRQLIIC